MLKRLSLTGGLLLICLGILLAYVAGSYNGLWFTGLLSAAIGFGIVAFNE